MNFTSDVENSVKAMSYASIPQKTIGPMRLRGPLVEGLISVPMATFESPLWPSTARGARLSRQTSGIYVACLADVMSRSILLQAPSVERALAFKAQLDQDKMAAVIASSGRFVRLQNMHIDLVGPLIYLRLSMTTGDAAGHNMVTKAADKLLTHLLAGQPELRYLSISGNTCVDKKVSAINGILGRGKSIIAEIVVPRALCQRYLRTEPEAIVELNIKKNLLGGILSGSLRAANAHFANMLLATYLATGQDAANIVEGSQGIVFTEMQADALYFSVNLPNLIVGTVGNGKTLPFVQDNLRQMGCLEPAQPGAQAQRLAGIIAASVLCGELSLLAAQTQPGELVQSHMRLERMTHPVQSTEV